MPTGRTMARGLLLLLSLSACTSTVPRTETETPPTQEDTDLAECRKRMAVAGPRPPAGGGPAGAFAARAWQSRRQQVVEECMRMKGYREEIP
jgi:hypothetical protein